MIKNANEIKEAGERNAVAILSDYVELKERGNKHVGCCPIHKEKTPSFTVYPDTGSYYCFGCGIGGGIVTFLMEAQNMTYPEALAHIAKKSHLNVEFAPNTNYDTTIKQSKEEAAKMDSMRIALDTVFEFFRTKEMPYKKIEVWGAEKGEEKKAMNIEGKVYLPEVVEKFELAYIPGGNQLTKSIKALQLDRELLRELKLLSVSDSSGDDYDFFRSRLIFPIRDHRGRLVSFAGRKSIDDDNKKNPKYVNGAETLIYDKTKTLYGLHLAAPHIKKSGFVYLVEGYTDTMTMHQYGYGNTVATCGTAFTDEQAKLLSRFTREIFILRDGDDAGRAAAARDVEVALRNGLTPQVIILPKVEQTAEQIEAGEKEEGEDPDSFLRKQNDRGFSYYQDENIRDGLTWRVMQEWDEKSMTRREATFKIAAQLLSYVKSQTLKQDYIDRLCKKNNLGDVRRRLADAAAELESWEKLTRVDDFTEQQIKDVKQYGVYEEKNAYWVPTGNGAEGYRISNFIVRPIFHLRAAQKSWRYLEVINERNKSFICDFPSDTLYDMNTFGKALSNWGDYLYNEYAKAEHHIKIRRKISGNMRTAWLLSKLGWSTAHNFYVWANGISHEGKFIAVDDLGLVTVGNDNFFLPALSKIRTQGKSDDNTESYDKQKDFQIFAVEKKMTFTEWTERMHDVYKGNGMIAVAFYLTSLYRDILFEQMNFFPLMFCFGPPQAGKTTMATSLTAMFGKSIKEYDLSMGTNSSFSARLELINNAITQLAEYSNDIDPVRMKTLRGAYDGTGRDRMSTENYKGFDTQKVNTAIVLTGEHLPTSLGSLYTRVIPCGFPTRIFTAAEVDAYEELRDFQNTGGLSNITNDALQYRDIVQDQFQDTFRAIRKEWKAKLAADKIRMEERILNSHLMICAMARLMRTKMKFAFDLAELEKVCIENMTEQTENIKSEDNTGVFWRLLQTMLDDRTVLHQREICIEEKKKVKTTKAKSLSGMYENHHWEKPRPLIFIRLANVHTNYAILHQRSQGKKALGATDLEFYLKQIPAYLGRKKSKRFGKAVYSCHVFDMTLLPVELPLTKNQEPELDDNCPTCLLEHDKCICPSGDDLLENAAGEGTENLDTNIKLL